MAPNWVGVMVFGNGFASSPDVALEANRSRARHVEDFDGSMSEQAKHRGRDECRHQCSQHQPQRGDGSPEEPTEEGLA